MLPGLHNGVIQLRGERQVIKAAPEVLTYEADIGPSSVAMICYAVLRPIPRLPALTMEKPPRQSCAFHVVILRPKNRSTNGRSICCLDGIVWPPPSTRQNRFVPLSRGIVLEDHHASIVWIAVQHYRNRATPCIDIFVPRLSVARGRRGGVRTAALGGTAVERRNEVRCTIGHTRGHRRSAGAPPR